MCQRQLVISFVLGSFSSKDLDAPALSHTFESQLLYCTVQYSTVQYSAALYSTYTTSLLFGSIVDDMQATEFTDIFKLMYDVTICCFDSQSTIYLNLLNWEKQRKTKENIFFQENIFRRTLANEPFPCETLHNRVTTFAHVQLYLLLEERKIAPNDRRYARRRQNYFKRISLCLEDPF